MGRVSGNTLVALKCDQLTRLYYLRKGFLQPEVNTQIAIYTMTTYGLYSAFCKPYFKRSQGES